MTEIYTEYLSKFVTIKNFKNAYKNWISVILQLQRGNQTIKVKTRSGSNVNFTPKQCRLYIQYLLYSNSPPEDCVYMLQNNIVPYKGHQIILDGLQENGDITGIYFKEEYTFLNVKDKIVIDIGANIGDSSIYFILKGAEKVIALEPYPYSYNYALENIKINNIEDKIIILNAGYGDNSEINIDKNKKTSVGTNLIESKNGLKIKLYSLNLLIEKYKLKEYNLALKMDCEGCEYNLIKENNSTLKKFKIIQLEYHYGYKTLKDKLEECGFNVKYSEPKKSYNKEAPKPNLTMGYIYAELP